MIHGPLFGDCVGVATIHVIIFGGFLTVGIRLLTKNSEIIGNFIDRLYFVTQSESLNNKI